MKSYLKGRLLRKALRQGANKGIISWEVIRWSYFLEKNSDKILIRTKLIWD